MQEKPEIDCLIIGHNAENFGDHKSFVEKLGFNSCANRDLSRNYINVEGKDYIFTDYFNSIKEYKSNPIDISETFSNTIAYLCSFLQKWNCSYEFVNSFNTEKDVLTDKLRVNKIVSVAITTTLYTTYQPLVEIIKLIRKYNNRTKIVVGGPFISTLIRNEEEYVQDYLFDLIGSDYYINSSQGEASLVRLISILKTDRIVSRIDNLIYKNENTWKRTCFKIERNSLSEYYIDWQLFKDRKIEYCALRTSISCPYTCLFCGFPEHAGKYEAMDIESFTIELESLKCLLSLKGIHFVDDTFNINKERFKKLLNIIIRNNVTIIWHSYIRCQLLDDEIVGMMKQSGCRGVYLGLESGSNAMLINMNKHATIEEYYKGLLLLKKYGIVTHGNFIIGFPGETSTTIRETIDFIKFSGLDFYKVNLWFCEHISPIWHYYRSNYSLKGGSFEWSHKTMNSKEANFYVDYIYRQINNPVWVPQYNFDFDNLMHLIYRGINLEIVKQILSQFNDINKKQYEIKFQNYRAY